MCGTPTVPFSSLLLDTIAAHGTAWAFAYYARRGLSLEEALIWVRLVRV